MTKAQSEIPDYTDWSAPDLVAEKARLAEQRTALRLQQNAVDAVLYARQAIDALPDAARRIVKLDLAGGLEPAGEVAS